ncbi:MAG: hypothetical protein ACREUG_04445, partial [Steroidobacteraceae bacterium]
MSAVRAASRPWPMLLVILSAAAASVLMPASAHASEASGSRPALSTRALWSLKDIGGEAGVMSISPSGRYVAFQLQQPELAANRYRLTWYISSTAPHSTPRPIADGGEIMLVPAPFGWLDGARADVRAQWSPDERWIAYRRRDGDAVQVWRARVDGTREEQVTHSSANVTSFAWRPDGSGIFFEAGRDRTRMARRDREEGQQGYLLDDRFMPQYSKRPLWFACDDPWHVPMPPSERCTEQIWTVSGSTEREATASEVHEYRALSAPDRPIGVDERRVIRGVSWNADHRRAAWLENLA